MEKSIVIFHLSELQQDYFRLANQMHMLEIVRQKIDKRGLQSFDKEDIMGELGNIQGRLNEMNGRLSSIADALK